ncbi:hypothetical protein evm_000317 [Chilo suppressalis]|nr:hypothetical protein evm_000317 [Chilo suppressalis]
MSSRLSVAMKPQAGIPILQRSLNTKSSSKTETNPNPKKICSDMVGPPDPITNLRKFVFKEPANETSLEKAYREMRTEVQKWHHNFWTQHNSRFFQEREEYLRKNLPIGKENLSADEMSVFYKSFLDRNWKSHIAYNKECGKALLFRSGKADQMSSRRRDGTEKSLQDVVTLLKELASDDVPSVVAKELHKPSHHVRPRLCHQVAQGH